MADGIRVERATVATDELVEAIARLMPLLSSAPLPDAAALQRMLDHHATTLFVARSDAGIVGMCSLVTFPIPTGVRAWVEDVVVDVDARGGGVASTLVEAAIDGARAEGARSIDLTSRPSREAANRLYQRLGFEQRQTNVYRFPIEG